MPDLETEYRSLTDAAGFVCLANQTLVRIEGNDRNQFLNSFCTADVKQLPPGQLTEAFVLNDKGKILSHVFCLALDDELLLVGTERQADVLMEHLDKYIIREDVRLADQSDGWAAIFVCGQDAALMLKKLFGSILPMNKQVVVTPGDSRIIVANLELAGNGFLLLTSMDDAEVLAAKLLEAGIPECSEESLHAVRIENRTPWFGRDIDSSNLPQELNRDDEAISFEKGCYLGQETVARIDALGHVNQLLVGLEFNGERPPAVGVELVADEKIAGRVTSVAKSVNDQTIGLGYVRRTKAKPGVRLEFPGGTATVAS